MVLMAARQRAVVPLPAVVVPDAGSWALWGHDLRSLGFAAAPPSRASVLIGPVRVPAPLADAVADAWRRMPEPRRHVALACPAAADGAELGSLLRREPVPGNDADVHEGMDHGDMMAIEGDPSADGLVMEPTDFALGPIGHVLPGGLVARVSLDGDVVASCSLVATLRAPADPLAPAASAVEPSIAAIEVERALSHVAWLGRFAHALGWGQLADRSHDALAPLVAAHRAPPAPGGHEDLLARLRAAEAPVRALARVLAPRRRLASRARGLAVVTREEAEDHGLAGPDARASGGAGDARSADPAYAALGFAPAVLEAGDAEARVLVRVQETAAALELAFAALSAGEPQARAAVEGPRGPIGPAAAPAADATLAVAGERAIGLEWSAAVAALASFDLSPWRVSG
jgi:hypothetical protein